VFAKKRILQHGEPAEATVLSVEERSHHTSNELRDYDHVLEVRPDDGSPPFQATVREKLWIVGLRPKAHDVLRVKYDPKSHEVVFDFAGDPRYDVDALNAQTEQRRAEVDDFKQRLIESGGMSRGAAGPNDPIDQLERLVKLRDAGALTPEEFEAQKARILG
jgi:hypothetical protein